MKSKFSLRKTANANSIIKKPRNKSEAAVKQFNRDERYKQINQAVEWCKINGKRGSVAISTGHFPLIKSKNGIDKRLDNLVLTGNEKKHLMILTAEEVDTIVEYVRCKNRSYQAMIS